jgi:hypothetical protein
VSSHDPASGRLIKAPENFIGPEGVRQVFREGKAGRRDFVRGAFAAALAGAAAPAAQIVQSYKPGDREGHVVNNMRFELKGTSSGNNEFSLLQGARS